MKKGTKKVIGYGLALGALYLFVIKPTMRTSSAIEDMVVKQVQTTQQQRPSELQLYGMGNPPNWY